MRITKHAEERIMERGITVGNLVHAMKNGVIMPHRTDGDKCVVRTDEIYVIMNKAMDVVITAFKNERGVQYA